MKNNLKNSDFGQSFISINADTLYMIPTVPFGTTVYCYYNKAVREAQMVSVHFIPYTKKLKGVEQIAILAKVAGYEDLQIFLIAINSPCTPFYRTKEDCLESYFTGNKSKNAITLGGASRIDIFKQFDFNAVYKQPEYYYWIENYKAAECVCFTEFNALWYDKTGFHLNFEKKLDFEGRPYERYLTEEACKRAHTPECISFANAN